MNLAKYVSNHAVRGACACGRCIDASQNPEDHQPEGHTVDVIFFKVAQANEPNREEFLSLSEEEYPHWFDGDEHSYLEIGADTSDQGIALITMALGKSLNVWELSTPKSMMPSLPSDLQMQMAGQGMITIKAI